MQGWTSKFYDHFSMPTIDATYPIIVKYIFHYKMYVFIYLIFGNMNLKLIHHSVGIPIRLFLMPVMTMGPATSNSMSIAAQLFLRQR